MVHHLLLHCIVAFDWWSFVLNAMDVIEKVLDLVWLEELGRQTFLRYFELSAVIYGVDIMDGMKPLYVEGYGNFGDSFDSIVP